MLPPEQPDATIYSSLIYQSHFHVVSNHISNRLQVRRPLSASETMKMNTTLEDWRNSLPDFFKIDLPPTSSSDWYLFARSKLSWRCWNLQILLMRPCILRWATQKARNSVSTEETTEEAECRRICVECAHQTILSVQNYVLTNPLSRLSAWYAL